MIARHHRDLEDWFHSLPASRKAMIDPSRTIAPSTVAHDNLLKVLCLRYHNVRIMIHRPALGLVLSALGSHTDSVLPSLGTASHFALYCQPSLEISIESAAAIITIANSFESDKSTPGMWWTLIQIGKEHHAA